jgi:hypothetical protein
MNFIIFLFFHLTIQFKLLKNDEASRSHHNQSPSPKYKIKSLQETTSEITQMSEMELSEREFVERKHKIRMAFRLCQQMMFLADSVDDPVDPCVGVIFNDDYFWT